MLRVIDFREDTIIDWDAIKMDETRRIMILFDFVFAMQLQGLLIQETPRS